MNADTVLKFVYKGAVITIVAISIFKPGIATAALQEMRPGLAALKPFIK